jgi:hypothetical protein
MKNKNTNTKNPSQTIEPTDTLPDFPEDQVQSNGIGDRLEHKAKNVGSAPE